ncbi:MAG: sigma-54 dependent transcriptional regulator [Desulfobulbaceae bacterium]|nr:sigma-54 dependent transcriptional regulator [Desulfobulbaceae bacterium]
MSNRYVAYKVVMKLRHVLCLLPDTIDPEIAKGLALAGWEVHFALESEQAKDLTRLYEINVGITEINRELTLPLFSQLRDDYSFAPHLKWIALVGPELMGREDVSQSIRDNFFDFHSLPIDKNRLLVTLGHAWGMASVSSRISSDPEDEQLLEEMVGSSPAIRKVFQTIRKYSGVEAPVLITGESGTGKELAARAIHERSLRASGPFVAVNCAALPHTLIHSELFGHEKGAFTGATEGKIGRVESASGGTIFLDEIGDLPMELQVNLLRFLQEKTIERVGGKKSISVDVRVISATNVDLEQAVANAKFREDLFYRLNVLNLEMPALRDRGDDVELLARYFLKLFSQEENSEKGYSQTALRTIKAYGWPGNVRELINLVRRAVVMSEKRLISPKDLGLNKPDSERKTMTLKEARATAEKDAVLSALSATGNNISHAARQLSVSRVTFYRLLEKYNITI